MQSTDELHHHSQDLLEVADVLNKAVTAVPAEALQESQYLKDMHQGLQLTETQLLKVFGMHQTWVIYIWLAIRCLESMVWYRKIQLVKNLTQTNMTPSSRFVPLFDSNGL